MICNEHLDGVPLLVLANKQDLPDCMGVRDIKPVFQQSAVHIGRRDCLVMPVSALTGEGVDEGIRWLVDAIIRNNVVRSPRIKDWAAATINCKFIPNKLLRFLSTSQSVWKVQWLLMIQRINFSTDRNQRLISSPYLKWYEIKTTFCVYGWA